MRPCEEGKVGMYVEKVLELRDVSCYGSSERIELCKERQSVYLAVLCWQARWRREEGKIERRANSACAVEASRRPCFEEKQPFAIEDSVLSVQSNIKVSLGLTVRILMSRQKFEEPNFHLFGLSWNVPRDGEDWQRGGGHLLGRHGSPETGEDPVRNMHGSQREGGVRIEYIYQEGLHSYMYNPFLDLKS